MDEKKEKSATSKYSEGDIVEVRWIDIEDECSWTPLDIVKLEKCPECKTVGYFISEDDECIKLCYSVANDMDVSRVFIPRGAIKSIRKIEEGELDDF